MTSSATHYSVSRYHISNKDRIVDPQRFKAACITLFGTPFFTKASLALNVSTRSVHNYARGITPIPAWMPARLQKLLVERMDRLTVERQLLEADALSDAAMATSDTPAGRALRASRPHPDTDKVRSLEQQVDGLRQTVQELLDRIAAAPTSQLVNSAAQASPEDDGDDDGWQDEIEENAV